MKGRVLHHSAEVGEVLSVIVIDTVLLQCSFSKKNAVTQMFLSVGNTPCL